MFETDVLIVLDAETNGSAAVQSHFATRLLDTELLPNVSHLRVGVYLLGHSDGFVLDFNDTSRSFNEVPTVDGGNVTMGIIEMLLSLDLPPPNSTRKGIVAIVIDGENSTSAEVQRLAQAIIPDAVEVVPVVVAQNATRQDAVEFLTDDMLAALRVPLCRENVSAMVLNGLPSDLVARAGRIFEYTIPQNTFWDEEFLFDLPIVVHPINTTSLPSWLSYDNATRTLVGVPDRRTSDVVPLEIWAANERVESPTEIVHITVVPDSSEQPIVVNLTAALLSPPVAPSLDGSRRLRRQALLASCERQPNGFTRVAAIHAIAAATNASVEDVLLLEAAPRIDACIYDAQFGVDSGCPGRKDVVEGLLDNGTRVIEGSLNSPAVPYASRRKRQEVVDVSVEFLRCRDIVIFETANDDDSTAAWVPYVVGLAVLLALLLLLAGLVLRRRMVPFDDALFGPRTPRVMTTEKHYPEDELTLLPLRPPRVLSAEKLVAPPLMRRPPYFRQAPPYIRAPEYGDRRKGGDAPPYRLPPAYPTDGRVILEADVPAAEVSRTTKVTTTTTTIIEHGNDDEDAAYWPLLDDDDVSPPPFVPPPEFLSPPMADAFLTRPFTDTTDIEAEFLADLTTAQTSWTPRRGADTPGSRGHTSIGTLLDAASHLRSELETAVAGTELGRETPGRTPIDGHALEADLDLSFLSAVGRTPVDGQPSARGGLGFLQAAQQLGDELELAVGATGESYDDVFYYADGGSHHGQLAEPFATGGNANTAELSISRQLLTAALELSENVEQSVRATSEI